MGHILPGAHVDGHNDIHVLCARRQKDYRDLRDGLDLLAPIEAVVQRQINVEQHQMWLGGSEFIQYHVLA